MRWLVFATALLANPQNVYLQNKALYFGDGDGVGGAAQWFPGQNAMSVGVPVDLPYTGRGLVIGMCSRTTGCDGDYTHMAGGFQILNDGDIGLLGSSASLANINTVDSANNDITFMIGGGSTLKRGAAIQLYNAGKFGGDTFDMKGSANEQSLLHVSSGVNQTGSASYALIIGEVHETSTGSGYKQLLRLGTNSGVPNAMAGANVGNGTDAAGFTAKFTVDSSGNTVATGLVQGGSLSLVQGGSETAIVDTVGDVSWNSGSELCWAQDGVASHAKDVCLYRTAAGELGVESTQGGTAYGAYAEMRLNSVANVSWNVGTKTALYTVPSGKSAIITKVAYRGASASATTASCGVGFDAGGVNVIASATHTALTGSTLYSVDPPKVGALIGTAGAVLGQVCTVLQGGALTVTADVYGYLF